MRTLRRPTIFFAIRATHGFSLPRGKGPHSPNSFLHSVVVMNDVLALSFMLMSAYALITCNRRKHVICHKFGIIHGDWSIRAHLIKIEPLVHISLKVFSC